MKIKINHYRGRNSEIDTDKKELLLHIHDGMAVEIDPSLLGRYKEFAEVARNPTCPKIVKNGCPCVGIHCSTCWSYYINNNSMIEEPE